MLAITHGGGRRLASLFLFLFGVGFSAVSAEGQWSGSVVFDRDGLRSLHLAVGSHYGVSPTSVSRSSPSWLHPDELPVVYLVASEARISPSVVISLREMGWSWIEIARELRVSPAIFVAGLPRRGPLAHRAGYWRPRSPHELWRLSDWEIIDFVNLTFWAQVHRRPVEHVVVIRQTVPTWVHYITLPAPRTVVLVQQVVQTQYVQAPPRVVVPAVQVSGGGGAVNQHSTGTVVQSPPVSARPAQPRPTAQPAQGAASGGSGNAVPAVRPAPGPNPAGLAGPSPATGRSGPALAPPATPSSRTAPNPPPVVPSVAPSAPSRATPPAAAAPPTATSTGGRGVAAPPVPVGRGGGGSPGGRSP
jgi:hypothetical protein